MVMQTNASSDKTLVMRRLKFTTFALYIVTIAFGQNTFKKNDLYLETGGNGLFGSVNYERQLTELPGLGARIGVGFYSENAFYLTFPVGFNYLFNLKSEKAFIDAGLGVTWSRRDNNLFASHNSTSDHFVYFVPSVGYRRHTLKNMLWRVSVTPFVYKYGVVPWIAASIGKRF